MRTIRDHETKLLSEIETVLLRHRGYAFRMPSKGKHVIALASGGLDTTVVMAVLMAKYGLHVHPLHINRHLENSEAVLRSLNQIGSVFRKQYPGLYHEPLTVDYPIPPQELTIPYSVRSPNERIFHTKFGDSPVFAQERPIDKTGHKQGIPLQPALYASLGMFYAQYLLDMEGIVVRTIFAASLPGNTDWFTYESPSAYRAITLMLCSQYHDYSWQFSCFPYEQTLGGPFDKDTIVRLGQKYRVPMELTRTCWTPGLTHCGECTNCYVRQKAFRDAGIPDPTVYRSGNGIFLTARLLLRQFLRHM